MTNKTLFAHIALLTANLIYALNYTFAKDVMPEFIMPSGFILLRVIGALILFGALFLFFVNEKVQQRDILRFAICGVFGVAINQLLFFEGLNLTTPINASIVMTINPILVIVFSFIILNEALTIRRITGIFLGFIGAYILILKGGEFNFSSDTQLGNLLVFVNATSYGLYLIIVKPLIEKYNPLTVMFYVFSFGLLFVFPFGYHNLISVEWKMIPINIYFEIIFVVVCTTFIAYLLNSAALSRLSPTTVSIYIYLQPIFATLFAIYWGVDNLNLQKITATIFIFFGVYLVSARSLKDKKDKLS